MLPSGEESKLKNNIQKIGFGGGCHWCTEAVFQSLKGIQKVEQGFISSEVENNFFSEAVIVHFDPETISLKTLTEVHLYTHKSTSEHSMRKKYRSAIYYFEDFQKNELREFISEVQPDFKNEIITKVLPFCNFKESDELFQNYYYKNPEKPFCETYINPKLSLLLKEFRSVVDKEKINHENHQTIHS